jgi:uncharacterized protein (DUF4415 family)
MKKGTPKALGAEGLPPDLLAQLQAAAALPDDQINTGDTDAPEVTDWTGAVRGKFYKPRKVQKTLRVDADVLAYFEAQGPGHLTRMNRVLRASMLRGLRRQRQHGRGAGGKVTTGS